MSEHDVSTRDGRVLRVADGGDPGGVPLLALHGMPGSRLMWDGDLIQAAQRGLRLLSYDRPGYGGSSPHPGRSVADCAADVRAIAGALEIRRLGVYGASGGGPHAAACAALLSDLVPAAGVLCSSAPWGAKGLDYFAGTGELNIEETKLYFDDPEAARVKAKQEREEMLAADLGGTMEMLGSLLSDVDREVLTEEFGALMIAHTNLGLAPSVEGWWDDGVASLSDWGFDLPAISTPVLLLHGRHDRFVPAAHGEWLAGVIPGVDARIYEDEGHLSLQVNRVREVWDWLVQRVR